MQVCKQACQHKSGQYWYGIVFICSSKTLLKFSMIADLWDVFPCSWVGALTVKPLSQGGSCGGCQSQHRDGGDSHAGCRDWGLHVGTDPCLTMGLVSAVMKNETLSTDVLWMMYSVDDICRRRAPERVWAFLVVSQEDVGKFGKEW